MTTLISRELSYPADDRTCRGSLHLDTRAPGPRPAVIVFPEFWGLNDYARRRARMLAEQGYVALAADPYGDGRQGQTREEAGALMQALRSDPRAGPARLRGALDALCAQAEVDATRVAVIGYCLGGAMALSAMRIGLPVRAVASFHGVLTSPYRARAGAPHPRVLVCHGAADPFVPADSVAAFEQEMQEAGVPYRLIAHPGATHGFTVPESDERARAFHMPLAYSAQADRASWAALLTHLHEALDLPDDTTEG